MKYYAYGQNAISASSFNDEYFRLMLRAGDSAYAKMDRKELVSFLETEYELFWMYIEHMVRDLKLVYKERPFLQCSHDGVTLGNGEKYQALGIQFVQTLDDFP